jgi:hypothetical protein
MLGRLYLENCLVCPISKDEHRLEFIFKKYKANDSYFAFEYVLGALRKVVG